MLITITVKNTTSVSFFYTMLKGYNLFSTKLLRWGIKFFNDAIERRHLSIYYNFSSLINGDKRFRVFLPQAKRFRNL
jgi:hypothetical protein